MSLAELRGEVERIAAMPEPPQDTALNVVARLLDALERGEARAARPGPDGAWTAEAWVKTGILLGFRVASDAETVLPPVFWFRDRAHLLSANEPAQRTGVRIVPGGTTVRRGAYLSPGVVVMPPAFVNVGAWVGPGTMIDSHALVGSCAQIGARVHLSAAAQIGGVLEPVGAVPVVVEDDVFVGGGCGVYEGTHVKRRAVLAAGVVLTRSVPLYDLVHGRIHRAQAGQPLTVPESAVVVPGTRPAAGDFARREGLALQCPVIVKYRDEASDAAATLEEALR